MKKTTGPISKPIGDQTYSASQNSNYFIRKIKLQEPVSVLGQVFIPSEE
ncbi:hypothetical protein [Leptospira ainazelensis]|nr:hypothetical protein [Leptospira ainazelensis]